MRRLASPSALFGIWTLLFSLPVVPIFIHRHSEPHVRHYVALPAPEMMKPFVVIYTLMPLLRFAPLSFPFFAIAFGVWRHITGRALDPILGRWQFALSTVPGILCVFIDAAILGFSRSGTVGPLNAKTASLLPVVLEATIYIVSLFWLASVALFLFNVTQTLRNESRWKAAP